MLGTADRAITCLSLHRSGAAGRSVDGPYDVVITSTVARAFETAIAMGFAVDEQWPALGLQPVEVLDEANWEGGCAEFVRAARLRDPTARYISSLRRP
ncbi:MAG TPA: hypothetical protein VKV73_06335 [Chloroflexota bacterium]|nr:hypothetical protein [Chloroflexota bacterium]